MTGVLIKRGNLDTEPHTQMEDTWTADADNPVGQRGRGRDQAAAGVPLGLGPS